MTCALQFRHLAAGFMVLACLQAFGPGGLSADAVGANPAPADGADRRGVVGGAAADAGFRDAAGVLTFARQLVDGRKLEVETTGSGSDAYEFTTAPDGTIHVTAGAARGVLYAVYDVLDGRTSGRESPAFSIRGINPCESLSRHSPEMAARLIDRMGRWKMNRIIIHSEYGFEAHRELILRECARRGIEVVYYLYDNLCFGSQVPRSCWAVDQAGNVRAPFERLEAYDRLCASKPETFAAYRKGVAGYLGRHPDFRSVMFATADGGDYCQCAGCRSRNPWGQVLPFFNVFFDEASTNRQRELLVYHQRFDVPEDISRISKLDGVMFDLHHRDRSIPLHDPEGRSERLAADARFSHITDVRLRNMPKHRYLYDCLLEWRRVCPGKVYTFDNTMIQGAWGVPSYSVPAYLDDLRQLKKAGIDGMIYEVFEPGIRANLPALDVFARAMWHPDAEYVLGAEQDPDMEKFFRLVREFKSNMSAGNLRALNTYLLNHPNRDQFDWIYIGFSSMKGAMNRNADLKGRMLRDSMDPAEAMFLETNKVWDFLEKVDSPRETALRVIERMLSRL